MEIVARLLFLTGTSPDVRGGSGTFVGISVLREALEALGHRIELVAPEPGDGPVSLAGRLLFNWRVRDAARKATPETIVGFDLDGLFLRSSPIPHIAAIKGVIAEEARFERGFPRLRLAVESFLEKLHVRQAHRVIVPSKHSAERVIAGYGVPPERVRVVPEPIGLARWRKALEEAPELPRTGKSILCVAHLYPRKDVVTLIAAMPRLPDDAILRVAGIGPELSRLKRLTQSLGLGKRVEFLGHVSFARLTGEYRRADIFCLPSRQEGFGIVFLEAMAAGLPIVAARAAAVPEVVAEGECGILVPAGEEATLAAALTRLLEDPAQRRRLSESGRRRVERYDSPRVAREFLHAIGIEDSGDPRYGWTS